MYQIDKQFSFCYGHRVWSQELNVNYCERGDTETKCRHLHGHEGLVHIFLEGDTLHKGMVTDFKHTGWMKNFLDDQLDHKFIIDQNDPMFQSMVMDVWEDYTGISLSSVQEFIEQCTTEVYVDDMVVARKITLDPNAVQTPLYEVLQGFTVVNFVPTSEHLCKWLFDIATHKMSAIAKVSRIDWWETPKSRSSYSI